MKKTLLFGAVLLAAPAYAQTLDGGQGMPCMKDIDCGGCGWVCSWQGANATNHICVPAVSGDPGWCTTAADCPCPSGAAVTCSSKNHCTPGFVAQCNCTSDCTGGEVCDQTTHACHASPSSCNYNGACGCYAGCPTGQCEALGGNIPNQPCSTGADCIACAGQTCVGGTCTQTFATCLSGGSSGGASTSGGSSSVSSGSSSSNGASGGSSSSGACLQVGASCTQNGDCCGQYCKSNVCRCNSGNGQYFDHWPCQTNEDCCSPATCAADGKCQGTPDGGSSSGGSSSGGAGTTGAADGGTSASKSGCGCGAGGVGIEGLASLALGLGLLATRRRKA